MNDANDGKFIIEYLGGVGYRISDIEYLGWYRISFFWVLSHWFLNMLSWKVSFHTALFWLLPYCFIYSNQKIYIFIKFAKGKKCKIVNGQSKMKVQYARYRRALYFHETVYKLVVKKCFLKLRYLYVSHHIYPRSRRSRDRFLRTLVVFLWLYW